MRVGHRSRSRLNPRTVDHGSEVDFVYGAVPLVDGTQAADVLSSIMIHYWVSFATSLNPNDGLGLSREPLNSWFSNTANDRALVPQDRIGLRTHQTMQ